MTTETLTIEEKLLRWRAANPVRQERENRRWSQATLALMTGVNPHCISRYEGGLFTPGPVIMEALAQALGIPDLVVRYLAWKAENPVRIEERKS